MKKQRFWRNKFRAGQIRRYHKQNDKPAERLENRVGKVNVQFTQAETLHWFNVVMKVLHLKVNSFRANNFNLYIVSLSLIRMYRVKSMDMSLFV